MSHEDGSLRGLLFPMVKKINNMDKKFLTSPEPSNKRTYLFFSCAFESVHNFVANLK